MVAASTSTYVEMVHLLIILYGILKNLSNHYGNVNQAPMAEPLENKIFSDHHDKNGLHE